MAARELRRAPINAYASVCRSSVNLPPPLLILAPGCEKEAALTALERGAASGVGYAAAFNTSIDPAFDLLRDTPRFKALAAKLDRNSTEEALVNQLYLTAACSIGRQENPRRLEMLINTLLPPDKRLRKFD